MDTILEKPRQLLPLNPKQVQKFIREVEVPFGNALKDLADIEGKGNGYEKFPSEVVEAKEEYIFTSAGLCDVASVSLFKILKKRFGDYSDIRIIRSPSRTYNFTDDQLKLTPDVKDIFMHIRIWFKGSDGNTYFIDPTYGQVNSHLNRIVVDRVEMEDRYYAWGKQKIHPIDVTEEELDIYNTRISKLRLTSSSSRHQDILHKLLALQELEIT